MIELGSMEEEDFGSWLGLATADGGGGTASLRSSHDEQPWRPPVQLGALLPVPHTKEEDRCDLKLGVTEKGSGEGAKKRVQVGDDASDGSGGSGGGARKKLRLSKEQTTLLEDSFRAHDIPSHVQKQELARQLNMSSRQVEVWFQNRRARTKLKRTEVECEFLKRCCDRLTDENQRLRHELLELRRAAPSTGLKLFALQLTGPEAMLNFASPARRSP